MRLEEEIHQRNFRNPRQKALINLVFTHGWVSHKLKSILRSYDLSIPQYNVLRILNGAFPEPLTTSTIAARMLDKASDASRLVDRMHKKGWVEKNVCENDKRLVDVKLSSKGKELTQQLALIDDDLDGILGNLSVEQASQLNELLDQLRG
ncbi:MAG: MarR family transcriptional regulator [Bacteroidota bacterium]